MRRIRRVSISSELIICGGDVRSILLLPLVARLVDLGRQPGMAVRTPVPINQLFND